VFWGRDAHVRQTRAAGVAQGLPYFASSGRWPCWPSVFATSGLAVLSRWPISRCEVFHFSKQSWFEWSIIRRGILMLQIEHPSGGKVAVMNVHTTPGSEVLDAGVGRQSHAINHSGFQQLQEALEEFKKFSSSAEHRIICGDFNLRKGSDAFNAWEAQALVMGFKDCFPACPPTYGCIDESTGDAAEWLLTKEADRGRPKVLDHAFSNIPCSCAAVEPMAMEGQDYQQVSDHRALAALWL